ncbi:MAG: hypothetical protein K8U03_10520 [Planctomycetia bacterium]|nr:hypothetical protein [Planctomycetia bacterium]
MKITSTTPFPDLSQTAGLLLVANSVAGIVDGLIPGIPPFGDRPISLVYQDKGPQVFWELQDHRGATYRVGLSSKGARWQNLAYQLSHELAHIKFGPARSNLLIETLAIAVSIRALELLRFDWGAHPPFPWDGWEAYAADLSKYIEREKTEQLSKLPNSIRTEFAGLAVKEKLRRLEVARVEVEKLPLNDAQCRAWQYAAATSLPWADIRWSGLIGIAMHTDPSPTDDPRYSFALKVLAKAIPAWVPDALR